jgi:pimeloyl-ACP methyl ester carboxylesterase
MTTTAVHDEGGCGAPILLLHGLMGSARTWRRQLSWLRDLGRVYTFDAAGHGRPAPAELSTEALVEDLVEQLGAAGLAGESFSVIGHSMGALHAWMLAHAHPKRVRALVIEDMAPDFRGRTADGWAALVRSWPLPFPTERAAKDYFGDIAGQYFLDSLDLRADGYHLHGSIETFRRISEEWGSRHFWDQWNSLAVPSLLIEAEHSITPPEQMREMARRPGARHALIRGAGHLVHDDKPAEFRAAVSEFLGSAATGSLVP